MSAQGLVRRSEVLLGWRVLVGGRSEAELAAQEVRRVHGAPAHGVPGPWALAGWRIGKDALERLGASRRQPWALLVTHRSPREVGYTCMLDGLQAATGASPGKMNLLHEAIEDGLETVIVDRRSGRTLTYRLAPEFEARFGDVDHADFPAAAFSLDALPDEAVFTVVAS